MADYYTPSQLASLTPQTEALLRAARQYQAANPYSAMAGDTSAGLARAVPPMSLPGSQRLFQPDLSTPGRGFASALRGVGGPLTAASLALHSTPTAAAPLDMSDPQRFYAEQAGRPDPRSWWQRSIGNAIQNYPTTMGQAALSVLPGANMLTGAQNMLSAFGSAQPTGQASEMPTRLAYNPNAPLYDYARGLSDALEQSYKNLRSRVNAPPRGYFSNPNQGYGANVTGAPPGSTFLPGYQPQNIPAAVAPDTTPSSALPWVMGGRSAAATPATAATPGQAAMTFGLDTAQGLAAFQPSPTPPQAQPLSDAQRFEAQKGVAAGPTFTGSDYAQAAQPIPGANPTYNVQRQMLGLPSSPEGLNINNTAPTNQPGVNYAGQYGNTQVYSSPGIDPRTGRPVTNFSDFANLNTPSGASSAPLPGQQPGLAPTAQNDIILGQGGGRMASIPGSGQGQSAIGQNAQNAQNAQNPAAQYALPFGSNVSRTGQDLTRANQMLLAANAMEAARTANTQGPVGGYGGTGGYTNPYPEYMRNLIDAQTEKVLNSAAYRAGAGFGSSMYPEHYRGGQGPAGGNATAFAGEMAKLAALDKLRAQYAPEVVAQTLTPLQRATLGQQGQHYALESQKLAAELPLHQAQANLYGAQAQHQQAQAAQEQQMMDLQYRAMNADTEEQRRKYLGQLMALRGHNIDQRPTTHVVGSGTDIYGGQGPQYLAVTSPSGETQFYNPAAMGAGQTEQTGQAGQEQYPHVSQFKNASDIPPGKPFYSAAGQLVVKDRLGNFIPYQAR